DIAERLARIRIDDRQAVGLKLAGDEAESAAVSIPAVDAEIETVVSTQAQALRNPDQAHSLQRDGLVEQLHVRLHAQVETQSARTLALAQRALPRVGAGKDQQQQ